MPETTPLIKAALNLRGGAGFDVYENWKRQDYHYKGDPELFHRTGYRLWRLSAQYLQIQKGVQEKKSVWNK